MPRKRKQVRVESSPLDNQQISELREAARSEAQAHTQEALTGDVSDYRERLRMEFGKSTALEKAISRFFSPGDDEGNPEVLRAAIENPEWTSYLAQMDALEDIARASQSFVDAADDVANAVDQVQGRPVAAQSLGIQDVAAAYIAEVNQRKDQAFSELRAALERWGQIKRGAGVHTLPSQ